MGAASKSPRNPGVDTALDLVGAHTADFEMASVEQVLPRNGCLDMRARLPVEADVDGRISGDALNRQTVDVAHGGKEAEM
jgi:hypothetical protein